MPVDYSIVIPAYNEKAYLAKTITQLKNAMTNIPLQGEIIVTDNNSTDNTAEIARQYGATVVFEPVNQISRARNTGARHANGRYIVFVDADTHVPVELLTKAIDNLETGHCCGGGATVTAKDIPLTVKAVLGYWNILSRTFKLAAGCFVYARKDDFDVSGGFSEKLYATEEAWFSVALKRAARKHKRKFIIITQPKVITSARKLKWFSYTYQLFLVIILFIFPFLMRYKWACNYWYKRPEENDSNR